MNETIKILVVGVGNMGLSHAKAYQSIDGFEIAGLVGLNIHQKTDLPDDFASLPRFTEYAEAFETCRPDAVSICSWTETHAEFSIKALKAGAHVFVEKPLALTVEDAEEVVKVAKQTNRKLVVGYILNHHPSWIKLIEIGRQLGKPLVMRMNLNQQSSGDMWASHKNLMKGQSPIVDCGVHYVDIMCQLTRSRPKSVHAIGARLSDEISLDMYNYGQLQVIFEDGSVGWYEAGWGPMMSETAFFVKDVIGPKGSVSIDMGDSKTKSDDIDSHTKTNSLCHHHAEINANQNFTTPDSIINMSEEPNHQELCNLEQRFFLKSIRKDLDLTDHLNRVIDSLKIVLAADRSFREKQVIQL
jgi:predicted dehydrogenase